MAVDHNANRLYREIMREAVLLGDSLLIKMVLKRIGNFPQSPIAGTKSNIISFPIEHSELATDLKEQQRLWATVLRTAMIPLGIFLFIAAFHYFSLYFSVPCQS